LLRFKAGDFSSRMPAELTGLEGKIADVFNDILHVSERRAAETARVCRVVGKEGKLKERMRVPGAVGGWADEIDALNTLIADLVCRRPRSRAPSEPSPRAISARRCRSTSTAARSKASSCARRSWSTR